MHVLVQSGFRVFFLLGPLYAAISLAAWLAMFVGAWGPPGSWPAPYWHGHEMLFGFVATAIAGFLLPAVPNWTDTPGLRGWPLAGLTAAWLAGRVALWLGDALPGGLVALADCFTLARCRVDRAYLSDTAETKPLLPMPMPSPVLRAHPSPGAHRADQPPRAAAARPARRPKKVPSARDRPLL